MSKNNGKFAKVDYHVIEDTELNAYDLAVFTVLTRFSNNDTGECYPNREIIAKLAGCSARKVTESIWSLANKGYISIKKDGLNNLYTVKFIKNN